MKRLAFALLLLLPSCPLLSPVTAQDFLGLEAFGEYQKSIEANDCTLPENKDRWGLRVPTQEEELEYGVGVLIFEYWNSLALCSDSYDGGVYFNGFRFRMKVEVLGREYGSRERVTLFTEETPYTVFTEPLLLEDGSEPGRIILYPMVS